MTSVVLQMPIIVPFQFREETFQCTAISIPSKPVSKMTIIIIIVSINAFKLSTSFLCTQEKSKEMDIMNIYTQRIRNAGKTQLNASPLVDTSDAVEVPAINNQASQTALSCPPSKDVCLHEKSELKMASSQTESVGKDVSEVAKCVNVSTQTKELSLLPLAKTGAATAAKAEKGKSKVPSQVAHTQNPKCTPSSVQQPQDLAESSGNGREIDAEKSKQKLIQKLRELDSQKAAPGSKPVPNVKSSGSLPSNVTSASQAFPTQHVHISGVPANMDAKLLPNTATNSNYLQQSNAADNTLQQNAVAQEKKQLLLAKLMAIDEGSDPSHMSSSARGAQKQPSTGSTNDSSSSSTMKQPSAESKTVGEDKNKVGSSLSSLGSWPEVVENMHHGRPAHARESDPFGSKFHQSRKTLGKGKSGPSSSGEKGNFGTRLRSSETNEHQSDGNKLRSQEQVAGSSSVQKVDMKRDSSSTNLRQTQREMASFGYTTSNSNVSVSHSRSGGTAELFSSPSSEIRKTTRFDHFPSWQAHDQPQMQPVFGEGSAIAPTLSENSLLPRRMKAKPAAVTGHDVMPGAISYVSEPDDLEEIVL